MGSVEGFANKPPEQAPVKCEAKKSGSECLWTAQGQFICQKENSLAPIVPNIEMANAVYETKNSAQFAHPWEN
jgi:hypothetical protein